VLCAIGFQAVARPCACRSGRVDAARLAQALAGGRADSRILQEFGPKMARRDYAPTGRIDNMMKDLEAWKALPPPNGCSASLGPALAQLHACSLPPASAAPTRPK